MKKPLRLLAPILFGLLINGLFTAKAPDVSAASMNTVQVTPVIEELTLDPLASTDKTITVSNRSTDETKVRVYTAPYSVLASNESDFETENKHTEIYHWLKIRDVDSNLKEEVNFTIGAGDIISVPYHIDVPESAPGGSQHACIFVETVPEKSASGITAVSRTAVKIFAEVSGETVRNAEIENLSTSGLFVISGKVSASTTVKNTGNVDIKPTLTMKINSLSGEEVYKDTKVAVIFPENEAELKIEWPNTPMFGVYNLIVSSSVIGINEKVEKVIFIMPIWFVLIILVIIAVIMVYVVRMRRRRARRRMVVG